MGMPKKDGGKGDFFAKVRVVLPTSLSSREKELVAELRRERG
jgi:DnaJ-class molecular chaperone